MPINRTHISGILLAGGMSRRMGCDKGKLLIANTPLYRYPLGVLEKMCDEILISTCKDSDFDTGYRCICDEVKEIGPLGGIYSCLKQSSNDLNLVLSYDMPLVNESLFRMLIGESKGYDLILPAMQEKRPEPLCGLYRKSVTGIMEEMIKVQDYTMQHLLPLCKSRILPINEEMDCWNKDLFLNINRREDLERIPPGFGTEGYEN